MDLLTFIATIVGSLVWPTSLLIVILVLRKPLAELLPDVSKLKYKDLEVDFGKKLERIEAAMDMIKDETKLKRDLPPDVQQEPLPKTRRELLDMLVDLSPNAAILESWRNVERTLDFYFHCRGIERPLSNQTITGHLDYDPNFPPQLVSAYQELRLLRNRAAHAQQNLSPEHAREFATLADRLTYALVEAANR